MSWQLNCDRCKNEIKSPDGEKTVFNEKLEPDSGPKIDATLTCSVTIEGKDKHWCMDCILRKILSVEFFRLGIRTV